MLAAYDSHGNTIVSGQRLTGRDGATYEFIEITRAPTATAFGMVRMRKVYDGPELAGRADAWRFSGLNPRNASSGFADIAFGITIR